SLAKAVNLSFASIAVSPARSRKVRSRASLRCCAAATFCLRFLRLASAIGGLRIELSVVVRTFVGRGPFRILVLFADDARAACEQRRAGDPEKRRGEGGGDLALVGLGVVYRVVDHVHRRVAQAVGDALADAAPGE